LSLACRIPKGFLLPTPPERRSPLSRETRDYPWDAHFPKVKKQEVPVEEIRRFDPGIRSFLNINRPEDVIRIQSLLTPLSSSTGEDPP
jgi:hypothetical protein